MAGGYGTQSNPLTIDSDDQASEGDANHCDSTHWDASKHSSFPGEADDCVYIRSSAKEIIDLDEEKGFVYGCSRLTEECSVAEMNPLSPEQQEIVKLVKEGKVRESLGVQNNTNNIDKVLAFRTGFGVTVSNE